MENENCDWCQHGPLTPPVFNHMLFPPNFTPWQIIELQLLQDYREPQEPNRYAPLDPNGERYLALQQFYFPFIRALQSYRFEQYQFELEQFQTSERLRMLNCVQSHLNVRNVLHTPKLTPISTKIDYNVNRCINNNSNNNLNQTVNQNTNTNLHENSHNNSNNNANNNSNSNTNNNLYDNLHDNLHDTLSHNLHMNDNTPDNSEEDNTPIRRLPKEHSTNADTCTWMQQEPLRLQQTLIVDNPGGEKILYRGEESLDYNSAGNVICYLGNPWKGKRLRDIMTTVAGRGFLHWWYNQPENPKYKQDGPKRNHLRKAIEYVFQQYNEHVAQYTTQQLENGNVQESK